jgi:hypothetical protein
MADRRTVVPFTAAERERPSDAPLRLAADHLVKVDPKSPMQGTYKQPPQ